MNGGLKSVITINQTIDDPYSRVSGDVNGSAIRWIRENSHRYLGKYKDGVMYICQLDDSNSNYYHDGTPAVLTGAEGDVFMRMPNFFYCGTEGDIVDINFSTVPFDNCVPWMDNALIGVYEMYVANNKGYSRSGVNSAAPMSYNSAISYSTNRGTGSGYQIIDFQMHCVIGSLYYAIYGNTCCKNTIGNGTSSVDKQTGQTNMLGMTDTIAGYNGDNQSINFLGLENWWGNKYEFIKDGKIKAGTSIITLDDPLNGGERTIPAFYYANYPKKMRFGRYLDLIVSSDDPNNGSKTVGYCEQQVFLTRFNSYNRVLRRSNCSNRPYNGVSFIASDLYDSFVDSYAVYGSRLAYRGNIIEIDNVQEFKNIVATN